MNELVIRASFSDWRTVKSRKVLQLVLEVPLEQQSEVLTILGAPMPDAETWCAIALLRQPAPEQESARPKDPKRSEAARERYLSLPAEEKLVIDAAMLTKSPAFIAWIASFSPQDANAYFKDYCGIKSKWELADNPAAQARYRMLLTQFARGTGRLAEERG